jgi:predicted glycosyltransferase
MENLYDRVIVYGSQEMYDPITSYRFPPDVRDKTSFVGFISGDESRPRTSARKAAAKELPHVLITVGGGEDGSRIVETYLSMLSAFGERAEFVSTILPGPLLSAEAVQQLRSAARRLPVRIRHFIPEVAPLLRRADLTISMGGYNAVAEIMSCAQRALIIPRDTPRKEQLLRAERLQELGLVSVIRMGELDPTNLFRAITRLIHDTHRPLNAARENHLLSLDGAAQLGRLLLDALSERARLRARP